MFITFCVFVNQIGWEAIQEKKRTILLIKTHTFLGKEGALPKNGKDTRRRVSQNHQL